MSRTFTDFVRSLDPSGEPPGAESFERLLKSLRRVLRAELAKRGLSEAPPGYLGILGARHWRDDSDALGELVAECYAYVFVDRLRNLLVHLRDKPTIDGLVFLAVRNFLYEKQKKHDPLGFRVFEMAHAAVAAAIEAGELHLLAGDPRIRNDTVLAFDPSTEPESLPSVRLDEQVSRWNDLLLPELVTAKGKNRERTVTVLRTLLAKLPAEGVDGFRFKELVDPLKNDARSRWAARLEHDSGETAVEDGGDELAEIVRLVNPDTGFEERESFERLVDCVEGGIDRLDESERLKDYLATLWSYLRSRSAEQGGGDLPSRRKIAETLRIPRNRMPELYGILGGLLRACGKASFPQPAVNPGGGMTTNGGSAMNRRSDPLERLRRRTAEARKRYTATETELRERIRETPRPGDLFLLPVSGELPVEWAVVETHPEDPRRLWVVPADANGLAGSADVAVPADAACAPLTLRCAFGLWIDARECDPARRTGALPAASLELARSRRRDLARETPAETPADADADSEYRAWIAEVVEPARGALAEGRVLAFRPGPKARPWSPWALAASILLALGVGFGGGLSWQRQGIGEQVPEPRVNEPFISLFPDEPARGDEGRLGVKAGAQYVTLFLNVAGMPFDKVGIEVVRPGFEEPRWRGEAKRKGAILRIDLPTHWPEGTYEVRLSAPSGGPDASPRFTPEDEPLATYEVQIEYDGPDVRNGE